MSEHVFYMVKGDGPTIVKHGCRSSAESEARRLARANPGKTFYVLQAVSAFARVEVQEIELLEELPF